jgi:putative ABC transport system permease protein
LVLAEALRANLKNRHYHAVIFKVVGATRWDILFSLVAEFLLLGAATALLATLLGTTIAYGFVNWIIRAPWEFWPLPVAVIAGGGVLATLALGMAGVRGALNRKAWPLLRNE